MKFEQILLKIEERKQKWLRFVQDAKTELEYNSMNSYFRRWRLRTDMIP